MSWIQSRMTDMVGVGPNHRPLSLTIEDISLSHGRNERIHSVDMPLPEAFDP